MTLDLIIATYNRAALLQACLESVVAASRPDGLSITVIVVDNNSKDNTRQIAESFHSQPGLTFRYIFVGRPGKSAALNEAIAQTSGEIIGLIDDDEQLDTAWFQVVYREFSGDAKLDYIGGPYRPNWESSPPSWLPQSFLGAIGIVNRNERATFSPSFEGMLMGGNAAIRRTVLEKALPYPEHLGKIGKRIRSGEDEVIYHRLLEQGAYGLVIPDMVILHWIPAERLTRKYFRKWAFGRGISIGSQLRERGFKGPSLLGIPRPTIGISLRSIARLFLGRTPTERFTAQLLILDCAGTLYGRYFY
jgi:glycosyltransferase involved in cell wall biosynthesis